MDGWMDGWMIQNPVLTSEIVDFFRLTSSWLSQRFHPVSDLVLSCYRPDLSSLDNVALVCVVLHRFRFVFGA